MRGFLGRRILPTTLDPVPELFRTAPGCITINSRELRELREHNDETMKMLLNYALHATEKEARNIGVWVRWKVKKKMAKVAPSSRLAMVNAVYRGRT